MNQTATTETTATETATAAPAAPKEPSKKSRAQAIFEAKLAARALGQYPTNREFRAAVLATIQAELGVSVASAATMYNSAKKDAETAGVATLGRDPKKEKVKTTTGKRGRPAGSKNKAKETVVVSTDPAAEPAPASEATPVTDTRAEEPALM